MKNLILLLTLAMFACVACSTEATTQQEQPEATAEANVEEETPVKMVYPADSVAEDGSSYHGLRISAEGAQPIAQLTSMMADKAEIQTKIEGTIDECCQKKGCWMTMTLDNGEKMRVRFKDYGFFVPKDAPGKMAVIDGRAYTDTTSVDELRHYAEDAGKSQEEIDQITEPEVSIAFEATGVVIK